MTHGSGYSRQACAEKIEIGSDGHIAQVEMTSCGLNDGPLICIGEYPAAICCNLTNGHMPHIGNSRTKKPIPRITSKANERYVADIMEGTLIGYKYFAFAGNTTIYLTYRGGGGTMMVSTELGRMAASMFLPSTDAWRESDAVIFIAKGALPLYFTFQGNGKIDLLRFRYIAG